MNSRLGYGHCCGAKSLPRRGGPFGDMTVDFAAGRVRVGDRAVDLTPREWALLELFLTHPGRVLSKDQIAERLSSVNEPLPPNAIDVHVSQLRTKLQPAGAYIWTVRGFGYLWESGAE